MIRQAATLVILRDAPTGPEVLLQCRGRGAPFMGGRYVFPGGPVEDHDQGVTYDLVDVPDADQLDARVAAIRATFEEAGVLLARTVTGDRVDAETLVGLRNDLLSGLRRAGLVLAVGALALAARWITPEQETRRYDTLFFRAVAPPHHAAGDGRETDDAVWIRPAEALEAIEEERMWAVPPTIRSLADLIDFRDAEEAVRVLDAAPAPTPIQPVLETRPDGSVWVVHDAFAPYRLR